MPINILTPGQLSKLNQQASRRSGRRGRPLQLKAIAENKKYPPRVRVEATTDAYREVLVHPNGMRLRKEGSTEWPLDRFTRKRLDEGAVKIVATVDAQQKRTPVVETPRQATRARSE